MSTTIVGPSDLHQSRRTRLSHASAVGNRADESSQQFLFVVDDGHGVLLRFKRGLDGVDAIDVWREPFVEVNYTMTTKDPT